MTAVVIDGKAFAAKVRAQVAAHGLGRDLHVAEVGRALPQRSGHRDDRDVVAGAVVRGGATRG